MQLFDDKQEPETILFDQRRKIICSQYTFTQQ